MPTINDATVVASAYDTSGNGGRKLVRLSDGTLIAGVRNGTTQIILYKSTDNSNTWVQHTTQGIGAANDFALVTDGIRIYLLFANSSSTTIEYRAYNTSSGSILFSGAIDSSQTTLGNISIDYSASDNTLHAAWASKNSTYPNSFNIRYAKGTINGDGSVAWGAVEQVTMVNSATYPNGAINPSITLDKNGVPSIICQGCFIMNDSTGSTVTYDNINIYKRDRTLIYTNATYVNSSWSGKTVYTVSSYTQSSPSAIFVPQSVNGLANGRIWVAWHGKDTSNTTYFQPKMAYSDDGGTTWTVTPNLVTAGADITNLSITVSKSGDLYVLWVNSSGITNVYKAVFNGSAWTLTNLLNKGGSYPSALYDPTLNFSSPLFIYKDTAKVGFYGTWTVTTISVTPGDIGAKSDKTNLLTYTITTDGTMGTITESVNGVVIGTKNIASGASAIVGLTQAQWDAVRFGKYDSQKIIDILPKDSASWEQGSYGGAAVGGSPAKTTNTASLRLINAPIKAEKNTAYTIGIASGYQMYVIEVNSSNIVTKNSATYVDNNALFTTTNDADKLYIQVRKVDGTTIVPTDIIVANPSLIYSAISNNTLIIEMGSDTFTYTFDKRLATTDDILSAVKAVQDSQNTFLPAVKKNLASAIRGKGGAVNDTDSFDAIVSALSGMASKRWASGIGNSNSSGYFSVSSLTFRPSTIFVYFNNNAQSQSGYFAKTSTINSYNSYDANYGVVLATSSGSNTSWINFGGFVISSTGFSFTSGSLYLQNSNIKWIAFE